MNPLLLLLPWFVVGALVLYALTRAIGLVWMRYRIRMAVLKRLEQDPELLASPKRMENAVAKASARYKISSRQDFAVTGIILAIIGLGFVVMGLELRSGSMAVGAYVGGFICAVLGALLTLLTLFSRWISRPRFDDVPQKDNEDDPAQ